MTLGITNATALRTGSICRAARINDGVGCVIVPQNPTVGSEHLFGFVINASPWSVGSEQDLESDLVGTTNLGISAIDNNELFLVVATVTVGSTDHYLMSRSGDTLLPGAVYTPSSETYLPFSIASNSTIGFIDVPITANGGDTYKRFDLTGSPVTQTHSANSALQNSSRRSLGACFLDSDDVLVAFYHGANRDIYFQIVNLSAGISQGTEDNSGIDFASSASSTSFLPSCLAPLTSTKAVALLPREAATDTLSLWTVNRTASAISSYGTPLDLGTSVIGGLVIPLSSSEILVAYKSSANELTLARYSISGDTFTLEDSGVVDRGTLVSQPYGLVYLGSSAIVSWAESGSVYVGQVTGLASSYELTHSSGGIPGFLL